MVLLHINDLGNLITTHVNGTQDHQDHNEVILFTW